MKAKDEGMRSWVRSLRDKNIPELEALLADVQRQENQALAPLAKRRAALRRALRQKLAAVTAEARAISYDGEAAGLPVIPIIHAPESPIGDVNLLMEDVPLTAPPFDRITIELARDLITKTGGLMPALEVKPMRGEEEKDQRLVAQWTIPRAITMAELVNMEHRVRSVYGRQTSGRKKNGRGWEQVVRYVDLQNKTAAGKEGIYLGPQGYWSAEATGVVVYRQFANSAEAHYLAQAHPEDWIMRSVEGTVTATQIELREGANGKDKPGLAQDKFLQLTIQLSYLLAKQRLIEDRVLMTAIFRALNGVGTSPIERGKLYGMKAVLDAIERVLVLPLQRPDLARSYRFRPESILLVGVPGIGKTFLAHYLMTSDYNAIFASVHSDRLHQDLLRSGERGMSPVFLKIDAIKDATSLPVVLLIDDIDVMLEKEEVVSKFLNLMQGIRQRGFHILASTNRPEKIDQRLLEPGRLSKIIHVQLPDEHDRAGVLLTHLADLPFRSEEEKRRVVTAMTAKTTGWTQRYLWELCVEAGRMHGSQVAEESRVGELDPGALPPLALENFEQAHTELLRGINLQELRAWDDRIAAFVSHARQKIGFGSTG